MEQVIADTVFTDPFNLMIRRMEGGNHEENVNEK